MSVQGIATLDRASNLAFLKQTGGTLVLQVNNTTTAASFPTVSAGDITLTSVAAGAQNGTFAAGSTLVFPKIITATGTLTDNAPSNVIVFDFFSNAVTAKLVPDGANSLDLVLSNTGTTAVTPGVANATAFTGNFLNPAGAKLTRISVTNGSSISGTIRNDGLVAGGITIANSALAGSLVNTGLVFGAIGVSGLVTGNGSTVGRGREFGHRRAGSQLCHSGRYPTRRADLLGEHFCVLRQRLFDGYPRRRGAELHGQHRE